MPVNTYCKIFQIKINSTPAAAPMKMIPAPNRRSTSKPYSWPTSSATLSARFANAGAIYPSTRWRFWNAGCTNTDTTPTQAMRRSWLYHKRLILLSYKCAIGSLTPAGEFCPKWYAERDMIRCTTRSHGGERSWMLRGLSVWIKPRLVAVLVPFMKLHVYWKRKLTIGTRFKVFNRRL